jgi:hypothetical protein
MARPKVATNPQRVEQRLTAIRQRIAAIDYICSGTLHRRTKLCGKPNCACARSPAARHGPYYQWSRRKGGRQDNAVIPATVVPRFRRAVVNYREIRRLLRVWEEESARLMLATNESTDEDSRS